MISVRMVTITAIASLPNPGLGFSNGGVFQTSFCQNDSIQWYGVTQIFLQDPGHGYRAEDRHNAIF